MLARLLRRFAADDAGATAIEYGLLSALIAVAAIASFMIFGSSLTNLMGVGPGSAAVVIDQQTAKIN